MKKLMAWVLVLMLTLGMVTFASAEGEKKYKLGDKMEDFTATLTDGTEVSLYGLLAEKKAVLINFWATWCSPCKNEFPFMQQAYDEMSDEIGIIALSTEPQDTNEAINALKDDLGLTTLPMGGDVGVSKRFDYAGIPTSVLVDRNGIICFQESGAVTSKEKFLRLFEPFTAEDYSEPVLLEKIPAVAPTTKAPTAEEVSAALNVHDEQIKVNVVSNPTKWFFSIADDGASVTAGNVGIEDTEASIDVVVTAEAGQSLGYDYLANSSAVVEGLTVAVNDATVRAYGNRTEWQTDCITFEQAGEYKVTFDYTCVVNFEPDRERMVGLRNVRMLSADEAAAVEAAKPVPPQKTLEGKTATIEIVKGSAKPVTVLNWENCPLVFDIMQDDLITLRIKLGADVDDNLAFIGLNRSCILMDNLNRDSEGYLLEFVTNGELETPDLGNVLSVGSSINDLTAAPLCDYRWYEREEDLNEDLKQLNIDNNMNVDWEYTDGSAKMAVTEAAPAAADDMAGKYVVTVVDEEGNPVPGAMIQICDATTCQVVPTDAEGKVIHTGAPYAYEFHVLSVPAEFAPDAELYKLPEEGGSLTITLKKQ